MTTGAAVMAALTFSQETEMSDKRAWGFRENEAQIFEDGVIPEGWYDSPAKVPPADAESPKRGRKPKAEAETEATEAGE